MPDRFNIVETGNPDQNVRVGELVDLRFGFGGQGGGMGSVRNVRSRRLGLILVRLRLMTVYDIENWVGERPVCVTLTLSVRDTISHEDVKQSRPKDASK